MADKMETRRAMLSQPMAGKSKAEIRETREKAIAALTSAGYSVVNTLFTDEWYKAGENGGARCGADPALFSREVAGKHEPLPRGVFLQRLGKRAWV